MNVPKRTTVWSSDYHLGFDPATDVLGDGDGLLVCAEEFEQSLRGNCAVGASDKSLGHDGRDSSTFADESGLQISPFVIPAHDTGVQLARLEET